MLIVWHLVEWHLSHVAHILLELNGTALTQLVDCRLLFLYSDLLIPSSQFLQPPLLFVISKWVFVINFDLLGLWRVPRKSAVS